MKNLARISVLIHALLSMLLVVLALDSSPVFAGGAPDTAKTRPFKMTLKDGKLTAQIRTAPLGKVIEEISRLTGAEIRWLSQEQDDPVSVEFTDLPLDEALERILKRNFTHSYTFTGNDKTLIGIWIASSGARSESVPTPDATNSLSIIKEAYSENVLESDRGGIKKDVTARIERTEWRPEPLPVEPVAEINLAEAPPSVRVEAIEVLAMHAEKDQEAKTILSHFAHTDPDPKVREIASSVLSRIK
jgi:hypothetical protein